MGGGTGTASHSGMKDLEDKLESVNFREYADDVLGFLCNVIIYGPKSQYKFRAIEGEISPSWHPPINLSDEESSEEKDFFSQRVYGREVIVNLAKKLGLIETNYFSEETSDYEISIEPTPEGTRVYEKAKSEGRLNGRGLLKDELSE